MLGKTEGKVERRAEDEMVGRHHQLSGHEFELTLGDSGGKHWCAAVYGIAKSRTKLSD